MDCRIIIRLRVQLRVFLFLKRYGTMLAWCDSAALFHHSAILKILHYASSEKGVYEKGLTL
jgi:hypothetical protein